MLFTRAEPPTISVNAISVTPQSEAWMFNLGIPLLGIMLITIGLGVAADVPFIFDSSSSGVAGYSADQLESMRASSPELSGVPSVSTPSDNEVLEFPVTGGGSTPGSTTEKKVSDLKIEFDIRVEPENSRVNEEAVVLALMYPGDLTIDQIASIYSYLKNGDDSKKGWGYVRDPRGIDNFRYANASLKLGDRANCVGGGDCDDFAILMAALVESIGGTTRIILARNSSVGGHAYTEVYLGNLNTQSNQVEDIINWLKQKFNTDKIYTHIDANTKEVWLNLDWGADEKGNAHPGGPFYQGDKHIVLCIRDKYAKTPLSLSELVVDDTNESVTDLPATSGQGDALILIKMPLSFTNDGMNDNSYGDLAYTLPSQVNVEADVLEISEYTGGKEVKASLFLNGSRVSLHLLYPLNPPQTEMSPEAMKSLLVSYDPAMIQATYRDERMSVGGLPAIWGRVENQIFVAYQPTSQNPVFIVMDGNMNEGNMADFLQNLKITIKEGISPETKPPEETDDSVAVASNRERMSQDRESAFAKMQAAREVMRR